MDLNWVDWLIVAVVGYYVVEGWTEDIFQLGSELAAFLGSLWLAVRFHRQAGGFLAEKFGLPSVWANVAGYVAVALLAQVVIDNLWEWIRLRWSFKMHSKPLTRSLAAVLAATKGVVLTTIGLWVILALPLRGSIKADIRSSELGSRLVRAAEKYGGGVKSELEQTVRETVKFLTITPQSTERVDLRSVVDQRLQLRVNEVEERRMVELVNAERAKVGVKALAVDAKIVVVARKHSQDMFERRYFSHLSPEGHDAGWRLEQGGVTFQTAGENLAYAPDVDTAHAGLMQSEGHRQNILSGDFGRIGIGIIDGGGWGMMVTQNFAD